ncbi:hypothetical protein MATL_G00160310 [Megalops atlanticus]|uniref:IQ domain-containing protein C n=1 Tax=Megalops atlanticus TaxID=7932 RepID=A0A9D3T1G0_MEGAT|nr:hypothetical protein MATL_G00160310 [Megalops atlanticus]
MEREDLERRITLFQAKARGFLVRKVFSGLSAEYEDIVREIEGELSHLEWRGSIIPKPYFIENAIVRQKAASTTTGDSGEPCSVASSNKQTGEPREEASAESQVPEKDNSQPSCSHHIATVEGGASSTPAEGHNETALHTSGPGLSPEAHSKDEPLEGGASLSLTDETSIWDSMTIDGGCSFLQKGPRNRSLVQELPRNQEDLRLHRKNLAMELLWLQQAIASRKKYLLLKQRLGLAEQ